MIVNQATTKRADFTQSEEDGESLAVTYLNTGITELVEITRVDKDGQKADKIVYNVNALREIISEIDKINNPPEIINVDRSKLSAPRIKDFRGGIPGPGEIQGNVDQSMERVDDSVPPVESFSPVSETPADWKISDGENQVSWKDDVKDRQVNIHRPAVIRNRGSTGHGFKRVGAEDLL